MPAPARQANAVTLDHIEVASHRAAGGLMCLLIRNERVVFAVVGRWP